MALTRVDITSEVFRTCVAHALTTEAEEIMGLLLGDVWYDERGAAVARVWVAMPQIRTDRRKDRVEASPEQLAQASAVAEQFSEASKRRTRVIGWYHSHPHITVLPSHVDVRTQAMYQSMDEGFIGLIFSVFNQDRGDKTQRVQMTAFQSMQQGWEHHAPVQRGSWDMDSPMAAAISASMAEARSAAAAEGQWVQKKVPLAVVPPTSHSEEGSLRDLITLCRVLFEEEQHAFSKAIEAASDTNGMISPLTAIHQAAEYQQHLARLIELVLAPALQSLAAAQAQAQLQQQQLRDLRDTLAIQAAASHQPRQPHEHSPRQHEQQAVYVPGMTQPAGRVSSMDHLLNAPASAIGSEPSPDIAAPWPIAAVAAERAAAHSLAATSQLSDAAPVNGPSPRTPQAGSTRDPAAAKIVFTEWVKDHSGELPASPAAASHSQGHHSQGQHGTRGTRRPPGADASVRYEGHGTAPVAPAFEWPEHSNWDDSSPLAPPSPKVARTGSSGDYRKLTAELLGSEQSSPVSASYLLSSSAPEADSPGALARRQNHASSEAAPAQSRLRSSGAKAPQHGTHPQRPGGGAGTSHAQPTALGGLPSAAGMQAQGARKQAAWRVQDPFDDLADVMTGLSFTNNKQHQQK